jgi:hypothetical protein
VLEEAAPSLQKLREVFAAVAVEAAGERQVVCALDEADRVELHEAHPLDQLQKRGGRSLTRGVVEEPLRPHQQQPRRLRFDCR